MNRMMRVAAVAVLMLAGSGTAQAAAFTNGGFEMGTDPGTFTNVGTGDSTTISGWTVTSGNVDYVGSYWMAGQGSRSIDLSGGTPGAIAQTFDTVAGTRYLVSFLLAGNPDRDPSLKTLTVAATGGSTDSYSFRANGKTRQAMGWTPYQYGFTATGASTTLTFASTTAGAYGPALDGVSLSTAAAVPEPASWAMLTIGFGLTGAVARRRKRMVPATA